MNIMLEHLRNHLSSISKEQFKKEWEEIKKINLGDSIIDEYFKHSKIGNISKNLQTEWITMKNRYSGMMACIAFEKERKKFCRISSILFFRYGIDMK